MNMDSSISTTNNGCPVFHYPLPNGAEASEAHIAACIENQLSQVEEHNTQVKHSNKRAEEESYRGADSKSQELGHLHLALQVRLLPATQCLGTHNGIETDAIMIFIFIFIMA